MPTGAAVAGMLGALVVSAPAGAAPSCNYAFYDPNPDASDMVAQRDQLDLVQGTLGLTADNSQLRVVMNILDLSKTIPTGVSFLDYEFFWNFTPSGASSPTTYAVDVQVDSLGDVTYRDGTETTLNGTYQFNPNPNSRAMGSFGLGQNGAIEVDVPLADIGSPQLGDVLSGPRAFTAEGLVSTPLTGPVNTQTLDSDGPGNSYTLGESTCIDPRQPTSGSGSSGGSGGSGGTGGTGGSGGSGGSSGSGAPPSGQATAYSRSVIVVVSSKRKHRRKHSKRHARTKKRSPRR